MERTNPTGGGLTGSGSRANPNTNPLGSSVEDTAQTAHRAADRIVDKASTQVDRLSETAHRAINTTSDVASSAAEWASAIPEQAKQAQAQLTEAAAASIRARPIATVAGALVVGYLLGRIGRP